MDTMHYVLFFLIALLVGSAFAIAGVIKTMAKYKMDKENDHR